MLYFILYFILYFYIIFYIIFFILYYYICYIIFAEKVEIPRLHLFCILLYFLHDLIVFAYTVPSAPVGIESGIIENAQLTSSSTINHLTPAHSARLNSEQSWCSSTADPNSWLQVFLGKQYTLTHIALQGGVETVIVKYERTEGEVNWITYSKSVYGTSIPKVVLLLLFIFCFNSQSSLS